MKKPRLTRRVYAYPYMVFLAMFIIVPLVLVFINAFFDVDNYVTLENFKIFFTETSSLSILAVSILVGIITTIICLIIGYPIAYIIKKYNISKAIVLLFILPMWVNFLIRTLATKSLFLALDIELGIGTVIFGMVYNYIPFMILPLNNVISSIDNSYLEASRDLGADEFTTFWRVILPMSLPGIISGITMVFIPTISTFAISELLSDSKIFLFGDSINMKFKENMYGVGSIMSMVMVAFVLISNFFINKVGKNSEQQNGRMLW